MTTAGRFIKRAMDIVVAAAILLVGWPILAILAILIRCDSPGPVLFRQERAGRGMQPFTLYKFRTLRADADPFGTSPRRPDDPRLTRIGRVLRETSFDELPQLWNVLRGEMSLVGPRPLYMSQARAFTPRQRRRLDVRPGLTGLAQIQGRGEVPHEDKLEIDVRYVEQANLRLDLKILWASLAFPFRRKEAYQKWH
ncbi:MAG TPA: sugar transferase [Phycisphaerae bacterium]|nr:sugar transferase [Phycisphaerae bacterium]